MEADPLVMEKVHLTYWASVMGHKSLYFGSSLWKRSPRATRRGEEVRRDLTQPNIYEYLRLPPFPEGIFMFGVSIRYSLYLQNSSFTRTHSKKKIHEQKNRPKRSSLQAWLSDISF